MCRHIEYTATDAQYAHITLNLHIFTISTKMSECAFPHKHFKQDICGKQTLIINDLNLYLFLIEIPKAEKITTLIVDVVKAALADPSSSASE